MNIMNTDEYFEADGKIPSHHVYKSLNDVPWYCGKCGSDLDKMSKCLLIGCDGCLSWYHRACVDLNQKQSHGFGRIVQFDFYPVKTVSGIALHMCILYRMSLLLF